jgi:SecD/SecF fusion protein
MVQNLPRKIFGIVLLSILSIWSIWTFQIHLGLDLSGGSRIVYKIPFEKAIEHKLIDPNQDRAALLQEIADVFQLRLDGSGMADIPIYPQGTEQLVIELPDRSEEEVEQIKSIIVNQGSLQFRIILEDSDDLGRQAEIEKFKTWFEANPDLKPIDFNLVPEVDGGPRSGVLWYALSAESEDSTLEAIPGVRAAPVRDEDVIRDRQEKEDSWVFTGADLANRGVYPARDTYGNPAVGFKFDDWAVEPFTLFTEEFKNRRMAIILSGEIHSAPNINDRLPGSGIITGGSAGFSPDEVKELTTVLKSGSLPIQPTLDSQSFVGPSLGQDSINTGRNSALIGLFSVFVFMLVYYWMNGVVACLALGFNAFILLGALYFTQATLTLPGLAGLVLTIGMAVDANILIFERVREERKRGREVPQAYKNGYENAFSTIIDANLTTLITALLLFAIGTGPVAGFAATLSLGIVSSMFSALVFSKVVMHWLVFHKKIITDVKMFKALAGNTAIKFTSLRKMAGIFSAVLILAGIGLLVREFDSMKGIDFAGGSSAQIRLAEPLSINDLRAKLPDSYKIQEYSVSGGVTGELSDRFLVKKKLTSEEAAAYSAGELEGMDLQTQFKAEIRSSLGSSLDATDPFAEVNTVGPRVSSEIQEKASSAIFWALLAIVIYMNFRFKEYRYGIAAVIAVFHDVLITLGFLALASWSGLVRIEINLEIIAAFLTIIGYSLNDTIVVFDRIRENIPRKKNLGFAEIIDVSINQSLSRTVLTSATTFFVLIVMFLANRPTHNVLEGFSFAMLVGVVVGTYSSMFVASPLLLFLDRYARKKKLS